MTRFCRHANVGRKDFRNPLAHAETIQPCFGQQDRVIFSAFHLPQSRIYVSSKVTKIEIRPNVRELCLTPQTARPHTRPLPETCKRRANQAIPHVVPPADRGKHQPRRRVRRNIFHAVHCEVNGFVQQRLFQFLDENSLAADLRKWRLLHFVARRLDDNDLRFHPRRRKQPLANGFRLPFGQQAAARADSQYPHGLSRFERNKSRSASTFRIFLRSSFSPRNFCAGSSSSFSSNSSIKLSIRNRSVSLRCAIDSMRSLMNALRSSCTLARSSSTRLTSSTLACHERNFPTCASTIFSARGISFSRAWRLCCTMSLRSSML